MKSITEHMNEAMGLVTEAKTMVGDIYWEDEEAAVDGCMALADDLERITGEDICKALHADPDDLGEELKMFVAIVMCVASYIRSIADMVQNHDVEVDFLQSIVTSVGPNFIDLELFLDDLYNETGEDVPLKYVQTFFKKYWDKIIRYVFHCKWA